MGNFDGQNPKYSAYKAMVLFTQVIQRETIQANEQICQTEIQGKLETRSRITCYNRFEIYKIYSKNKNEIEIAFKANQKRKIVEMNAF